MWARTAGAARCNSWTSGLAARGVLLRYGGLACVGRRCWPPHSSGHVPQDAVVLIDEKRLRVTGHAAKEANLRVVKVEIDPVTIV